MIGDARRTRTLYGLVSRAGAETSTTLAHHTSGVHVHVGLGLLALIAVVVIAAVIFFAERRRKA